MEYICDFEDSDDMCSLIDQKEPVTRCRDCLYGTATKENDVECWYDDLSTVPLDGFCWRGRPRKEE